jgi:hypothetical protein
MNTRSAINNVVIMILMALTAAVGCRSLSDLDPAPPNTDPIVFDDEYGAYVSYQAFLGSKYDAVTVDAEEKVIGSASLEVIIPADGWSGGAFTTSLVRDLSGYDALTFWAKASKTSTLNVAGLGNDNTGTSRYTAEWDNIPLTTNWAKYVIPIPLPARLDQEKGLFFFAEANEGGESHTVWFDEVKFEKLGTITNPRPVINTQTVKTFVGAMVDFEGTRTTFAVESVDRTIQHMSGYFTFASSNEDVAVSIGDRVRAVGPGSAIITASLDGITAAGQVTLDVSDAPTTPAPTPIHPANTVISMFSNHYSPDVTVDSWLTTWSVEASVNDFDVDGDDMKVYSYSTIGYAGIDFSNDQVDATSMNYFHIDVWVPEGSLNFKVKLVDFGPNGVSDYPNPGDDSECQLAFYDASVPPLVIGTWASLDIPLEDFMGGPDGLDERGHIAQLILSGWSDNAFVDNIYFHE